MDSPRNSPWGNTTRDEKNHLEFGKTEYNIIDNYCKEQNIIWYASSWDVESQLFLRKYDTNYNKIASAMLTNFELLKTVAEEKKSTFISTGMSDLDIIRKAISIFKQNDCPFELLHTNSSYPMDVEESKSPATTASMNWHPLSVNSKNPEPALVPGRNRRPRFVQRGFGSYSERVVNPRSTAALSLGRILDVALGGTTQSQLVQDAMAPYHRSPSVFHSTGFPFCRNPTDEE